MKIVTNCKDCKKEISLKRRASNRYELSKKIGNYVDVACPHCGYRSTYHLNSFDAEKGRWVGFVFPVAILLSILSIVYLWGYTMKTMAIEIAIVPTVALNMIASAITYSSEQRIRYFNKYLAEK